MDIAAAIERIEKQQDEIARRISAMENAMNARTYTVDELKDILKTSDWKVRQLINTGKLKAVQDSNVLRVSNYHLQEYLKSHTNA